MTYERAAEILDPEHRETYESLEIVNEACRMGRAALFRRMPEPPHPDGDESILACPTCGSGEYLYNEDGNRCSSGARECSSPSRRDGSSSSRHWWARSSTRSAVSGNSRRS